MPCRSDYMEPTAGEIELSRILELLKEITGKDYDHSRAGHGYGDGYNSFSQERLDAATAQLCLACQNTDVKNYSLELQLWWRDHQKADARHRDEDLYNNES